MDLAFNNLQRLMCHKTKPEPNWRFTFRVYKLSAAPHSLLLLVTFVTSSKIYRAAELYLKYQNIAKHDVPVCTSKN